MVKATSVMIQRDTSSMRLPRGASHRRCARCTRHARRRRRRLRRLRRHGHLRCRIETGARRLRGSVARAGLRASTATSSPDADVKFSFAGSDDLAAQIRQGVTPDVYAAANTSLPDELYKDDLIEKPTTFVTNRLVVGVPADSDIDDISDLEQPGTTIAIGDEDVPVGHLHPRGARRARPRREDGDPRQRRQQRARRRRDRRQAHAGGRRRRLHLPQRRRCDERGDQADRHPQVGEPRCRVRGRRDDRRGSARVSPQQFVDGVVSGEGQDILLDSGFGPPPDAE